MFALGKDTIAEIVTVVSCGYGLYTAIGTVRNNAAIRQMEAEKTERAVEDARRAEADRRQAEQDALRAESRGNIDRDYANSLEARNDLRADNAALRARLAAAEETLRVLQAEVDGRNGQLLRRGFKTPDKAFAFIDEALQFIDQGGRPQKGITMKLPRLLPAPADATETPDSDLTVTRSGRTLTLAGEMDLGNRHRLHEHVYAAMREPGEGLTADIRGLTFTDSSGLAELKSLLVAGPVTLICRKGQPLEVLWRTRMADLFKIVDGANQE